MPRLDLSWLTPPHFHPGDGELDVVAQVLAGGKNRFGAEGETAWFEMGASGLREIDPTDLLVSAERVAGAAVVTPSNSPSPFATWRYQMA